MKTTIRFLDDAVAEYREARRWHEKQRRGLGNQFVAAVERTISRIAATPQRFARVEGGVRQASVKKFSYVVVFRDYPNVIEVVSVFHTSRDPRSWMTRLSNDE